VAECTLTTPPRTPTLTPGPARPFGRPTAAPGVSEEHRAGRGNVHRQSSCNVTTSRVTRAESHSEVGCKVYGTVGMPDSYHARVITLRPTALIQTPPMALTARDVGYGHLASPKPLMEVALLVPVWRHMTHSTGHRVSERVSVEGFIRLIDMAYPCSAALGTATHIRTGSGHPAFRTVSQRPLIAIRSAPGGWATLITLCGAVPAARVPALQQPLPGRAMAIRQLNKLN
jgi:hypothetical protein